MKESAITLMLSGGGVMAVLGAIKVYQKIQKGEDPWGAVTVWFGGCFAMAAFAAALHNLF